MSLGNLLFELRKEKNLSQEEVADRLNVTRQTVSKWETDQSTPDFDKIVPICELYGISTDELLNGKKDEVVGNDYASDSFYSGDEKKMDVSEVKQKKAKGLVFGILGYFVAVVWIMIAIPVLLIDPIVASGIFLLICGGATCLIIYTCMIYKVSKDKKDEKKNTVLKQIEDIIAIIFVIIYLAISFATMAWHITWIIWVVYGLITEILKLIFMLKENENEK